MPRFFFTMCSRRARTFKESRLFLSSSLIPGFHRMDIPPFFMRVHRLDAIWRMGID